MKHIGWTVDTNLEERAVSVSLAMLLEEGSLITAARRPLITPRGSNAFETKLVPR